MQDGTVNVHTIKDGQFVRTLMPIDCTGPSINITFLALSYQGNLARLILIYKILIQMCANFIFDFFFFFFAAQAILRFQPLMIHHIRSMYTALMVHIWAQNMFRAV